MWTKNQLRNGSAVEGLMWWDSIKVNHHTGGSYDDDGNCFELENYTGFNSVDFRQSVTLSRQTETLRFRCAYMPPSEYDSEYGDKEIFHYIEIRVRYGDNQVDYINIPLRRDHEGIDDWKAWRPEEITPGANTNLVDDGWTAGRLEEINRQWLYIDEELQLDTKEVIEVEVRLLPQGFHDNPDFNAYADTFELEGYFERGDVDELTYIPVNESGIFEIPVFGAVSDIEIGSVHFVTKEAIDGAVNDLKLRLIHKPTDEYVATLTFTDEHSAGAYDVVEWGPAGREMAYGEALSLRCIRGTAPQGVLIIGWRHI